MCCILCSEQTAGISINNIEWSLSWRWIIFNMRQVLNCCVLFTWISCSSAEVGSRNLKHNTSVTNERGYMLHSVTILSHSMTNNLIKEKPINCLNELHSSTLMGQTQNTEHLQWPDNINMKFHIFSLTNQKKFGWILEFKAHFNSISKWILRFWSLYFNLLMLKELFIHTARNLSIYRSVVCLIFAATQRQVKKSAQ